MRRTSWGRWLTGAMALGAALVVLVPGTAALAGSTSITDASGVDYDAACYQSGSITPPAPNSYASPGGPGCPFGSTYDGSTEATDLNGASLASDATGHIVATCRIDGSVPAAGYTNPTAADLPSAQFNSLGCKLLFQNKNVETNVPTNPKGGCTRVGTSTPVFDTHGSWKDGFHFFVGFDDTFDGTRWVQSVRLGEYDPSPNGGFMYSVLGTNDGTGWSNANPNHSFGAAGATGWSVTISGTGPTTITMTAPGVLSVPNSVDCVTGVFKVDYQSPGDTIANVKALTSANEAWPGGAVMHFSDTTDGNSTAGLFNTNIVGIAWTPGRDGAPIGMEWLDPLVLTARTDDYGQQGSGGLFVTDTQGPGPACPTPTHGGVTPQNPLFLPDTACQIDDDPFTRGSLWPEFWQTVHGFTA